MSCIDWSLINYSGSAEITFFGHQNERWANLYGNLQKNFQWLTRWSIRKDPWLTLLYPLLSLFYRLMQWFELHSIEDRINGRAAYTFGSPNFDHLAVDAKFSVNYTLHSKKCSYIVNKDTPGIKWAHRQPHRAIGHRVASLWKFFDLSGVYLWEPLYIKQYVNCADNRVYDEKHNPWRRGKSK